MEGKVNGCARQYAIFLLDVDGTGQLTLPGDTECSVDSMLYKQGSMTRP